MGQGSSPFSFFHATATAALASKGPRLTFRTVLVETPSRAAILRMLSRARKASRIRRSISGGYRRLAKLLAEVVARPDTPVDVARSRGDRFAGPSRGDYGKGTVNKGLISARQRLTRRRRLPRNGLRRPPTAARPEQRTTCRRAPRGCPAPPIPPQWRAMTYSLPPVAPEC
jgi:hypothetical protein